MKLFFRNHSLVHLVLFFFVFTFPHTSKAVKIDDTHYRFCIMDNAKITNLDAVEAERQDRLPFIPSADWYSNNGVLINGSKTYLSVSNSVTSINVLMTELYDGDNYSIRHLWCKGYNGMAYDQTTKFYISTDAPTGVSLNSAPKRMLIGDTITLSPSLLGDYTPFSGNGYFDYTYSVSNAEVLSNSSQSITITAKDLGKVSISVQVYAKNRSYSGSFYIGKASADIEVVENMDPESIKLDMNELVLHVGKETLLSATLHPDDARGKISWTSSDTTIASVDKGRITGVKRGRCVIEVFTNNGLFAQCNVTILGEEDYKSDCLDISDVNKEWGCSRDKVISTQSSNYYLFQENENSIHYSTFIDTTKVFISYKFDLNNNLCASALSFPLSPANQEFSDYIISQYKQDVSIVEGIETIVHNNEIITYDHSSTITGGSILTIGFSYFEPLEDRDDCVDLGLSVRWATCNLGASEPTEVGDFYAWSETFTKSEYWRENYSYCNNNANKYIFNYTNPLSNICGTSYDAATVKLGDGWRMPNLAEVNELISLCTWEKEEIQGVSVYRITGPNGNSIILPIVGEKKQAREYESSWLHIATGESATKNSSDFFILTDARNEYSYGSIDSNWKAWGYNIRPIYTK